MTDFTALDAVPDLLAEVFEERAAHVAKWGVQSHDDGPVGRRIDKAAEFQAKCAYDFDKETLGDPTWRSILAEEVAEVYGASTAAERRVELVQVAAVALAWIEDLDRKEARR